MQKAIFRGLTQSSNKWVYGTLLQTESVYEGINAAAIAQVKHTAAAGFYILNPVYVKPESVGQFTGMIDDSPESIFVGDIFEPISKKIQYVVSFDRGGFCILMDGGRYWGSLHRYKEVCAELSLPFRVVGNIHEREEAPEPR